MPDQNVNEICSYVYKCLELNVGCLIGWVNPIFKWAVLNWKTKHQKSSPSNGRQDDIPYHDPSKITYVNSLFGCFGSVPHHSMIYCSRVSPTANH